jgi:DNA-binding GntR family transcriptional regulator
MIFQPKTRVSLRDDIVVDLRNAIMRGALKAGERIYEGRISSEMQVSRVPVREALIQLEQEGLVVRHPNKGVFVAKLSKVQLSEFYSLRSVIEEFAMTLAMSNATNEDIARLRELIQAMEDSFKRDDKYAVFEADLRFHQVLAESSHHTLLVHFWKQIADMLRVQYVTLLPVLYPMRENIAGRHQLLLDAMLGQDVDYARAAIRDHVIAAGESLAAEARRNGFVDEDLEQE